MVRYIRKKTDLYTLETLKGLQTIAKLLSWLKCLSILAVAYRSHERYPLILTAVPPVEVVNADPRAQEGRKQPD